MSQTPSPVLSIPAFAEFRVQKNSIENNYGMCGVCSTRASVDGVEFELTATLEQDEPDNSNDEARAKCQLTLSLSVDGKTIATYGPSGHEYHGSSPGDYLCDMLQTEELFDGFMDDLQEGRLSTPSTAALA